MAYSKKDSNCTNIYIKIEGIYCEHCIERITKALLALPGVRHVSVRQNIAFVSGDQIPENDILIDAITDLGYVTNQSMISKERRDLTKAMRLHEFFLIAIAILIMVFGIEKLFSYNIFNAIPNVNSSMSYGMLFVTGLLTSVHCISMCGAIGIFASAELNSVRSIRRPLMYNAGRLISYTLIGGFAGLLGSVLSISAATRGIIMISAAILMLLMAFSMLGVISFRLPAMFRFRNIGNSLGVFGIGILNGFMPCGPLQAMQIYALSTGSFVKGALSMALFALGTVPLMLASGAVINLSKGKAKIMIGKVASVLMVILAISVLNRGLLSAGIDLTRILPSQYEDYAASRIEGNIQTLEFNLEYDSYADVVVQKGIPVRMIIHADESRITGCNNEVISSELGFDVVLSEGDNMVEFTPSDVGDYTYTCWMNMIVNHIKVIDDIGFFE